MMSSQDKKKVVNHPLMGLGPALNHHQRNVPR